MPAAAWPIRWKILHVDAHFHLLDAKNVNWLSLLLMLAHRVEIIIVALYSLRQFEGGYKLNSKEAILALRHNWQYCIFTAIAYARIGKVKGSDGHAQLRRTWRRKVHVQTRRQRSHQTDTCRRASHGQFYTPHTLIVQRPDFHNILRFILRLSLSLS